MLLVGSIAVLLAVLGAAAWIGYEGSADEADELFDARLATSARVLAALGATQQNLMLRDMDYRRVEVLTMLAGLAGGIAAVAAAGSALDGDALRAWGKQQLAAAKVPSRFVFVDDLPRNTLGKVVKPEVAKLFT